MCLIVLVLIGVVLFIIFTRPKPVTPVSIEGETPIELEEETAIDDDGEQFGMYESSLPSWLAHHPSVDRYTQRQRQQIHNVSSVNAAMPPTRSDYIPYNEQARFQTPGLYIPTVNPDFSNHIRNSNSEK